jgi:hypothetical protein
MKFLSLIILCLMSSSAFASAPSHYKCDTNDTVSSSLYNVGGIVDGQIDLMIDQAKGEAVETAIGSDGSKVVYNFQSDSGYVRGFVRVNHPDERIYLAMEMPHPYLRLRNLQ